MSREQVAKGIVDIVHVWSDINQLKRD